MFQNMSRIDMLYEIYLTSLEKPAWLSLELAKKAQPGKQNQGQVFKSVMLVDLLESSVCTMQTRKKNDTYLQRSAIPRKQAANTL